jgi:hypothetical protein
MFRKLMFGAMAAVGLGFGAETASAQPVPQRGQPLPILSQRGPIGGSPSHRGDIDFVVLIQRHHGGWERYGRFETYNEARRVERRLERDGFRVRIEEVRDHRRW